MSRQAITKLIQYLTWFGALAILWVLLQYIFIGSSRSIPIIKYIKIHTDEFKKNDVMIVQHQQVPFVLINRTQQHINQLKQTYKTEDALRSISEDYFIALAIGTNYGCIVTKYKQDTLKETCSQTLYDYSGRALNGEHKPLTVPQMTYDPKTQFYNLTLR